jgi:hypothetical protein
MRTSRCSSPRAFWRRKPSTSKASPRSARSSRTIAWSKAPEGGAGKDEEHAKIHGGFALSHWSGDPDIEARLKADLSVSLRCIPFDDHDGPGVCPFSGKPSAKRVVWAKSY